MQKKRGVLEKNNKQASSNKALLKKILVVDDDKTLLELIELRFKSEGYDVLSASDGFDAIKKAPEFKPDLVIVDIMMPKIDGYHLVKALTLIDGFKKPKIIMLTALARDDDKGLAENIGADMYVNKPFDFTELLRIVEKLLSKKS
ncbi:MAG: response regulator [Elusimicrobiota bacterium]